MMREKSHVRLEVLWILGVHRVYFLYVPKVEVFI